MHSSSVLLSTRTKPRPPGLSEAHHTEARSLASFIALVFLPVEAAALGTAAALGLFRAGDAAPPPSPAAFRAKLRSVQFANGSDAVSHPGPTRSPWPQVLLSWSMVRSRVAQDLVADLYDRTLHAVLHTCKRLKYRGLGWGPDEVGHPRRTQCTRVRH